MDYLKLLYTTVPGRGILKLLVHPGVSKLCGKFMDSGLSIPLIRPFIKKNGIDMEEYEETTYTCFNEFFYRQIKKENRPMELAPEILMAPCDGLLTCIPITQDRVIPVKQSAYTIPSLLRDRKLAQEYEDGLCLVFRLCVNHYHRYVYPDHGEIRAKRHINGVLHTVRPIALEHCSVFTENSREYMVLDTDNFGRVIQMEVGAMLVGKIENYDAKGSFEKGLEKGRFLYGGSTIILLLKKDAVELDERFRDSLENGIEIPVKMGERIGAVALKSASVL